MMCPAGEALHPHFICKCVDQDVIDQLEQNWIDSATDDDDMNSMNEFDDFEDFSEELPIDEISVPPLEKGEQCDEE